MLQTLLSMELIKRGNTTSTFIYLYMYVCLHVCKGNGDFWYSWDIPLQKCIKFLCNFSPAKRKAHLSSLYISGGFIWKPAAAKLKKFYAHSIRWSSVLYFTLLCEHAIKLYTSEDWWRNYRHFSSIDFYDTFMGKESASLFIHNFKTRGQ